MSLKVIILTFTSIAVASVAAGAILNWSKNMRAQTPIDLVITAKGLDEFGVTLEVPYEGRSASDVLILAGGPQAGPGDAAGPYIPPQKNQIDVRGVIDILRATDEELPVAPP